MGTIKSDVRLQLAGHTYFTDIRVGLYVTNMSPAIILFESDDDPTSDHIESVLATATANVDKNWLTGFPEGCVVAKNYSENEGLWEQLATLKDDEGQALFLPTGKKVTLSPFVTGEVFQLSGEAFRMYKQLKGETRGH